MKKLKFLKAKATNLISSGAGLAIATTVCVAGSTVFAAANATGMLQLMIRIFAAVIIVLGLWYGIAGITHYTSAKGDGDGPAQSKATGQIASGVMIVVLSVILMAQAGNLAGMIVTSI